jgi:hypothetical protein
MSSDWKVVAELVLRGFLFGFGGGGSMLAVQTFGNQEVGDSELEGWIV